MLKFTFEMLNHLLILYENNLVNFQYVNILEYNIINQIEHHINMKDFYDLNVIIFLIHLKMFL